MTRSSTFTVLAGALAMTLFAGDAGAQNYPTRPITVIVPFAAGGPTDVIARIVGESMSRNLGQQLVVENVGGAGGTTGITRGSQATPDGYTIMMGHMGTQAAAPALYPRLRYDPTKDFEPIGIAASTPILVVARKDLGPKTMQELVTYLKANQDKVNEGHAGVGSVSFTTCTIFNVMLGVKPTRVPYTGTGPVINDMLARKLDYACDQIVNLAPHIQAGTIAAFAIAQQTRSPALPDVPTSAEAGVPNFQVTAWNALFAPKNTPAPVVQRLSAALSTALDDETTRKRLLDLGGIIPQGEQRGGKYLGEFVASEVAKWTPILKAGGVVAPE
jgi:tripartite-type tricarboxylate transporter receptor subunit TctC